MSLSKKRAKKTAQKLILWLSHENFALIKMSVIVGVFLLGEPRHEFMTNIN